MRVHAESHEIDLTEQDLLCFVTCDLEVTLYIASLRFGEHLRGQICGRNK